MLPHTYPLKETYGNAGLNYMPTKEPTTRQLRKDIDGIDVRLGTAENWIERQELYKQVLADVKKQELADDKQKRSDEFQAKKMEVYKQLAIILGLVAVILSAYAATKGIK